MPIRTIAPVLAAFAAILISCSNEQKPLKTTATRAQAVSAADTTIPGKYAAQAWEFVKAAEFDSAEAYYEKAGKLYEKEKKWEKYIFCLGKIGELYSRKGEFDQAKARLTLALEIGVKLLGVQHLEIASIYHTLGIVHDILGEYDRALEFNQRALNIRLAQLGPQDAAVGRSYGNMGIIYAEKGDFDQALSCYEKSLQIKLTKLGESNEEVASDYGNMGLAYADKGDYDRAIAFHNKALSIHLTITGGRTPEVANNYNNIGIVYEKKGDYDQAIGFYDKALRLKIAILGAQHPEVALTCYNLANVYAAKKDYDRALDFYSKDVAITIATLGKAHPELAVSYTGMANLFKKKGDDKQALEFYNKALSLTESKLGQQHHYLADSYNGIGEIHVKRENLDQALRAYNKALTILLAQLGERHPKVAITKVRIAEIYEAKGDYHRALDFMQQALQANTSEVVSPDPYSNPTPKNIFSETHFLETLKTKAMMFAHLYNNKPHAQHDLQSAVSTLQSAMQLVDQMRRGYKTEGAKLFLAEEAAGVYDDAIRLALQLHTATQQMELRHTAFQFAEKSKAGVMLEALAELEGRQFAGIPDSLLAQEKQWRIDLNFYESNLTEEQFKRTQSDSAKIASWKDKIFALKQVYDALLQRFEQEYPDYYNLKYQSKTVSVPEVQQLLDDRTALVEYFIGKDSIFIFVITKDNFSVKTSLKDSLFEKRIEQLRQGIVKQDFAQYAQAAHHLYQTLLAPVADQLNDKKLIIVPDGVLSAIPFEALLTEQVANGKGQDYAGLPYLMNEHAVSYAYSATLLQQEQARQKRQTKRDYLAFAPVFANGLPAGTRSGDFFNENLKAGAPNPAAATASATRIRGYLPMTKKEVTGVLDRFENSYNIFDRWFGNKARAYLEKEAREARVKTGDLGEYRVLHFATHGLINEKNPKLSGLLLAPEDSTSQEDGILHLGEIYNLNLNADLVVLSACETGLGQVAKGEGIIGLTRGFLYAGASNLLVSLWQVSDATTADLMVDFYDKMLGGMSKSAALREAKLQMIRRHAEYAKPYYWAPFVLIGR